MVAPSCIPSGHTWGLPWPTFFPHLFLSALNPGPSQGCGGISSLFWLAFLDVMWSTFSRAHSSSVYFLRWGTHPCLCPISQLACLSSYCWVLRVLCILWMTVLHYKVFCKYFHTVHDLSFVWTVSFRDHKCLILTRSSLPIVLQTWNWRRGPYPVSLSFTAS